MTAVRPLFFAANFDHKAGLHALVNLPDSTLPGEAKALRCILANGDQNRMHLNGNTLQIDLPAGGFQAGEIR